MSAGAHKFNYISDETKMNEGKEKVVKVIKQFGRKFFYNLTEFLKVMCFLEL